MRSKLLTMRVRNLGCIGPDGVDVALDEIVCIVGRNNTGKSTVLRAYVLAQSSQALSETDWHQGTPEGDVAEVELDVHIPDGIPNVDSKWKVTVDEHRVVRSRWRWKAPGSPPVRQTWDPDTCDWAEDGKAGGADNVFNSRLPKPMRIDSLQDGQKEHDELLKLVTDPIAKELAKLQGDKDSDLGKALQAVLAHTLAPVAAFQEEIDEVSADLRKRFGEVLPGLAIELKVGVQPVTFDAAKNLVAGSSVRLKEGATETRYAQQGSGSRRALFWSLLQVRNALALRRGTVDRLDGARRKLQKEKEKGKAGSAAERKLEAELRQLEDGDGLALPGYILLLDEPENALHPAAIRSARRQLYALGRDPDWQVMLTTHSPYFIDPLEDHTTVVRLERPEHGTMSSRVFRADSPKFSEDDRRNLRALLQLDPTLCEVFFGSYPIIVEGDTEYAGFLAAIVEPGDALGERVALVRARGKALIDPLVRLLTHFKVPFGVLHDADAPKCANGNKNGAWTENVKIADSVLAARARGLEVRHRISVPDFERRLGLPEGNKDKPFVVYDAVRTDPALKAGVRELFGEIHAGVTQPPFASDPPCDTRDATLNALQLAVEQWAAANAAGDGRYQF